MKKKLLYFGCIGHAGHSLFEYDSPGGYIRATSANLREYFPQSNLECLKAIDGTFGPHTREQGKYNDCTIPPLRIVSWWDYTIDSRPGSNSNLIGIGYESAEEMIDDAYKIFPSVMNRQPRPTKA